MFSSHILAYFAMIDMISVKFMIISRASIDNVVKRS